MNNIANRRRFLQTAAVVPLATMMGGSGLHAAVDPIRRAGGARLKTALNAYSFSKLLNDYVKGRGPGMNLFQLVDFCAQHDIDGLDATGYFFPGYPQAPDDKYVNELKRRAFHVGIDISGTGVRNNFTTADTAIRAADVQHIKQWVEVAARLGAPVLRVFADTQMRSQTWETVSRGATRDRVEEWIAQDLRICAEHGEKFGVIIGVQNHGDFLRTSADHLNLIQRVDSPWCGPIVDTGYYKSEDPYEDIAQVAPYAVNWQIKQSPIGAGSDVRTDLTRLLTIVRQTGYRGYLPIETLSTPDKDYDPFQIVPQFLAELRTAIDATASITPPPDEPEPIPPVSPPAPPQRTRKKPNKKKSLGKVPPVQRTYGKPPFC